MREKEHTNYPSRFAIGESVILKLSGYSINCYIRAVLFSNSKVRYSVYVKADKTTIHNIDSCFIEDDLENVKDKGDFGDDNYS